MCLGTSQSPKSSAVACDNFLLRASQASRGAVLIHRTQFLVKNKTDRKAQNNELKLQIVSFCLTIEFSIIIGVLRSVFYCLNAAKITAVYSQAAISAYLLYTALTLRCLRPTRHFHPPSSCCLLSHWSRLRPKSCIQAPEPWLQLSSPALLIRL